MHEHAGVGIADQTARNSRMDAVMERAAESIVYDLISVESPGGAGATLVDPNSSFGN